MLGKGKIRLERRRPIPTPITAAARHVSVPSCAVLCLLLLCNEAKHQDCCRAHLLPPLMADCDCCLRFEVCQTQRMSRCCSSWLALPGVLLPLLPWLLLLAVGLTAAAASPQRNEAATMLLVAVAAAARWWALRHLSFLRGMAYGQRFVKHGAWDKKCEV